MSRSLKTQKKRILAGARLWMLLVVTLVSLGGVPRAAAQTASSASTSTQTTSSTTTASATTPTTSSSTATQAAVVQSSSGSTADPMAQSATAGTATGFSVNTGATVGVSPSTGEANLTYAIQTPAARGLVHAGVNLVYGSSSSTGELGVGWSLDLPSIERRPPAGLRGAPTYTTSDSFAYAGQTLVFVCVVGSSSCNLPSNEPAIPSGFEGSSYFRLAVDHLFARFFLSPDQTFWHVELNGEYLIFGAPPGARVAANAIDYEAHLPAPVTGSVATNAYRWRISRRWDDMGQNANTVLYVWQKVAPGVPGDEQLSQLTDIYDTPSASDAYGGSDLPTFAHHVHFTWQTPTLPQQSYAAMWNLKPSSQIAAITVASATWGGAARQLVRRYDFAYTPGQLSNGYTIGTQSFLSTITQEGCEGLGIADGSLDDELLPVCSVFKGVTSFTWNQSNVVSPTTTTIGSFPYKNTGLQIGGQTVDVVDLNGDGYPDFLAEDDVGSVFLNYHGEYFLQNLAGNAPYNNTQHAVGNWLLNGQVNVFSASGVAGANGSASPVCSYYSPTLTPYLNPKAPSGSSGSLWTSVTASCPLPEYFQPSNYAVCEATNTLGVTNASSGCNGGWTYPLGNQQMINWNSGTKPCGDPIDAPGSSNTCATCSWNLCGGGTNG